MRAAMYHAPGAFPLPKSPTATTLPWIQVAPDAPYFVDETDAPFTPIGQNDAISWPDLAGLFRRKDMAAVETICAG
jgi:mannan endo-1,4-beta-mannosidase